MTTLVRSPVEPERADPLFLALPLPAGPAEVQAIRARSGSPDGIGELIDRLLLAAMVTSAAGVAHLEGGRDAVRYALEVAGEAAEPRPDSVTALSGRRAAVRFTVRPAGARVLADAWLPGLSLGLAAPADDPVVTLMRHPSGYVLLATGARLPAAARRLIEQLPQEPLPAPLEASEAGEAAPRQASGARVIAGLAAVSVLAVVVAALVATSRGSPPPIAAGLTPAPTAGIARAVPVTPGGPPVANGVIAADPATGTVVLVGCCLDSSVRTGVATWSWDGRRWSRLPDRGSIPPFQPGLLLAYDDAVGGLVLQGGAQESGTWIWAGGSWTQAPTGQEPPTGALAMAYDPVIHRLVLVVPDPLTFAAQTWAWDGKAWAQIGIGDPFLNSPGALAFDPTTGQLMLAGVSSAPYPETVWTLTDQGSWRLDRQIPGFTYDPSTQLAWDGVSGHLIAVALGPDATPVNGATLPVDTWAWDGSSWTPQPAQGAPAENGLLVSTVNRHVLFVGVDLNNGAPDLWTWTGGSWVRIAAVPVPKLVGPEAGKH